MPHHFFLPAIWARSIHHSYGWWSLQLRSAHSNHLQISINFLYSPWRYQVIQVYRCAVQVVVSSPYLRCAQTAAVICRELGPSMLGWNECGVNPLTAQNAGRTLQQGPLDVLFIISRGKRVLPIIMWHEYLLVSDARKLWRHNRSLAVASYSNILKLWSPLYAAKDHFDVWWNLCLSCIGPKPEAYSANTPGPTPFLVSGISPMSMTVSMTFDIHIIDPHGVVDDRWKVVFCILKSIILGMVDAASFSLDTPRHSWTLLYPFCSQATVACCKCLSYSYDLYAKELPRIPHNRREVSLFRISNDHPLIWDNIKYWYCRFLLHTTYRHIKECESRIAWSKTSGWSVISSPYKMLQLNW